ncbi:cysteine hydrolase family protein [Pandoraea sputorum]|uniref:Peroxyureidoacrylate/ureidoacrylate amidohydrolase RutB n=1 Tax=Pandoraea sputorum TaxID=93222 RepID=A0A239S7S1_9BURK|nr:cysteine hydrolase [Pandoraea sputorum]BET12532.1 isochorismatase family protein [Pandoraea sputorum]SNU80844.1 Peroxyureidoacrylate/ureidoacrylate amidohydrolase RutB [Pandoraea sputorum]VVD75014.1 cysteine hydrolase [Pandoraea sputorum]
MTHLLLRTLKLATIGLSLSMAAAAVTAGESKNAPAPTIRAMLGATPVDHLDPKRTALIVIDFQNEYFTGRMPIPDRAQALANTKKLIDMADRAGIEVYQIQHVAPAGSAVFALGGKTVEFAPGAEPRARDTVLQKTTVSVFASTDLDKRLKAKGIDTVVIAGLMTHACVAGAARDAAPLGYRVVVASDASATRDIQRVDGSRVTSAALHRAALAEIEDTFGDVLTTAQILKLPQR